MNRIPQYKEVRSWANPLSVLNETERMGLPGHYATRGIPRESPMRTAYDRTGQLDSCGIGRFRR